VIGFLKGKSAIAIARLCGKERNFAGEHFWARGYAISTVGFELEQVRQYIREQESAEPAPSAKCSWHPPRYHVRPPRKDDPAKLRWLEKTIADRLDPVQILDALADTENLLNGRDPSARSPATKPATPRAGINPTEQLVWGQDPLIPLISQVIAGMPTRAAPALKWPWACFFRNGCGSRFSGKFPAIVAR
jgi:hypothetical protein